MSSEVLISTLHLLSCVHGPAKHSHALALVTATGLNNSPGEAKRDKPSPQLSLAGISLISGGF